MELKLGLVQMRMSQGRDSNLQKAAAMIRESAERGARIVCLPEL